MMSSIRPLVPRRAVLAALSLLATTLSFAAPSPAGGAHEARVRQLLAEMTVEEKAGQLVQYSSRDDMTGPPSEASLAPLIKAGAIGSLLNITGAADTRKWQKEAVEAHRLGIPLLFGYDVIHGYRTVLPIPLATASSWDLAAIERGERIAAIEASAAGLHWTFAPMMDVARDPRWGRISEGSGEDPYLGSLIAAARVRGFQGTDLAALDTILACAKHFAAYGAAQAGRDYWTTDVSERALREVYLPPFRAAVDAGVGSFMAGFNDLDGTPASMNAFLLQRVLRQEWGFKGFVVSDWGSIKEMIAHGSVADLREATHKAFVAGVDMDMENQAYGTHLAALVKSGVVPLQRLDEAAGAVLLAKAQLGLLDDPYRYSNEAREKDTLLRADLREGARDLARRSFVLLKNERATLPLKHGVKVALIGPMADNPLQQLGAWKGRGDERDTLTVRQAFQQVFGADKVAYAPGADLKRRDTSGFAAAVQAAQQSDVVVAVVGEGEDQSGEAGSRAYIDLSGSQAELIQAVRQAGKPIVMILMAGRPITLENVEPMVDAILVAWHPGTMGGPAVADVVTGAYNPAGRLTITWPRTLGQVPIFYNHKNSGRPTSGKPTDRYWSRYVDVPNDPQYPFGYGLSYTDFAYEGLALSTAKMTAGGAPLVVTAQVRNTGKVAGETVVQLYVRDRVGSVTRPVRELKGFRKVRLAPGETQTVEFQLTTADLSFWRADMTFGFEPGDFDVFVGGNAHATMTATFVLEE